MLAGRPPALRRGQAPREEAACSQPGLTGWLAGWLAGEHHSLEKLQGDGPSRFRLHALAPELQLWVDGAVEHEVLAETL